MLDTSWDSSSSGKVMFLSTSSTTRPSDVINYFRIDWKMEGFKDHEVDYMCERLSS